MALYDVVIYELQTSVVEAVVGESLRYLKAERRLATVLNRLNDSFSAAIVGAGEFRVGSKLTADALSVNDWTESRRQI